MIVVIILLSVVLLVAFVAACTKGSGIASRQEEYLEKCEKQKHNNHKS